MDEYQEPTEPYTEEVGESQLPEIRNNFISKLTSTHERYMNLWYQLRGYAPDIKGNWKYYGKELSGELFANKAVAQFSSIVNDTNSLTRKSDDECKRILHDAVEIFVYDMYIDETIEDSDTYVLAKIYEHNIELFLGLVEAGHGSKVITAILTGQKLDMNQEQRNDISLGDWMRNKAK